MPRTAPPDRLDRLVDVATRVFVEQGYRRTQMADVADALGVAEWPDELVSRRNRLHRALRRHLAAVSADQDRGVSSAVGAGWGTASPCWIARTDDGMSPCPL